MKTTKLFLFSQGSPGPVGPPGPKGDPVSTPVSKNNQKQKL